MGLFSLQFSDQSISYVELCTNDDAQSVITSGGSSACNMILFGSIIVVRSVTTHVK